MIIGVPKEIMVGEGRVGITPNGVRALISAGHKVIIQSRAGEASGFSDSNYSQAGANIEEKSQVIYQADLIVKVKEPQKEEWELLTEGGVIFAFLHLPANPELIAVLLKKKITGIAYEGIQLEGGERPILYEMSKIAGELAVKESPNYLLREPSDSMVLILGAAGAVGQAAIKKALELKFKKIVAVDLPEKLSKILSDKYQTVASTQDNIKKLLKETNLLIGGVAVSGSRAPRLVTKEMVSLMKPGSVIVDVAIDEGGCVETSRPTTHNNPVFVEKGVIHYCVKNIPGAVPQISTPALTAATLPYILEIASKGFEEAVKENPALARGVHVYRGEITNPTLAKLFGEK